MRSHDTSTPETLIDAIKKTANGPTDLPPTVESALIWMMHSLEDLQLVGQAGEDDDEMLFYNDDENNNDDSNNSGANFREATNFGAGM